MPDKKIIINLSPSEQKKNSPIFDLAMAIGVMKETGDIKDDIPADAAFLGVLSLDGSIKPVNGMLPAIIAAKKEGFKILYLPRIIDLPITEREGIEFRFVGTLQEVIDSFSGQLNMFSTSSIPSKQSTEDSVLTYSKDFQHILGHEKAKCALKISAAGGHNVLMVGPPGCGNRRDPLFKDEYDFDVFLSIIQSVAKKTPFEFVTYCLMTNHFHLQLRSTIQPVSKVMSLINKRYADYYNTKNNLTGHVFEKRYYDKIIPTKQGMLEVCRYIHLNPVDARMVGKPGDYEWISYGSYLNGPAVSPLDTSYILGYYSGSDSDKNRNYQEFVEGRSKITCAEDLSGL